MLSKKKICGRSKSRFKWVKNQLVQKIKIMLGIFQLILSHLMGLKFCPAQTVLEHVSCIPGLNVSCDMNSFICSVFWFGKLMKPHRSLSAHPPPPSSSSLTFEIIHIFLLLRFRFSITIIPPRFVNPIFCKFSLCFSWSDLFLTEFVVSLFILKI